MAPRIIIDAGHGGNDGGAVYNGRLEKEDNLRLALAVGEILEQDGYDVVYTRKEDVFDSPTQKARIANEAGGDYFVSFHRNSSPNPNTYSGVETLVYNDEGIKGELARSVNEELSKAGYADLGVSERPNLTVLRRTKMPAILIEAGFINTDADNRLFDQNFTAIARAIATGIENVVGDEGKGKQYGVQIGLYRRYGNALYQLQQLINLGYTAEISEQGEYYSVKTVGYTTIEEAQKAQNQLRDLGYETLIVETK